ncbi:erythromycin esterase family protein [Roseobacter sp. YSTF-M11]|uniref:Erythromycin esterase family protein n=1 Tax=Roseobacter insulae TaxID=2859783 RepID=A0A9X1FRD0_9RHOB|nr:erythromycin esterase family protein [Roseobacter insulae]MBW4706203.1 erythromycin esterase family protein [Roseobacter insulae]
MDNLVFTFADRKEAGQKLASELAGRKLDDPVIFALPRGGVPVAAEVARRLKAPLDLLLVRKIGTPGNPEVALGAIVEGINAQVVINQDILQLSGADMDYLERSYAGALAELDRRKRRLIGDRDRLDPAGRTAIVVDDGLATGATMKAALIALRRNGAPMIIVALPVAPKKALAELNAYADEILCLNAATGFHGMGGFFRDFHQLSDAETVALLRQCWKPEASVHTRKVVIPPVGLVGALTIPKNPVGLVIFAHGSGSGSRDRRVAGTLNERGCATLLFNLLTPDEAQVRRNLSDIALLAERLVGASMWAVSEPDLADLPLAIFGADTGAGAALVAAADLKDRVACVVSRGERPDLAGPALPRVNAPTLLVVGSRDHDVITLNEQALAAMRCTKKLQIVPRAGHLFEEPGTLDRVVEHAATWMTQYLRHPADPPRAAASPTPDGDLAVLRRAAEPLPDINDPSFGACFDRFGTHRVVLLGEASHGTSEFYRARAAITRRLIEAHGFSIVAVEADWPDAAAIDRHVRRSPHRPMSKAAFARFPTWMWRNTDVEAFVTYLRDHNSTRYPDDRVSFHGLDLYNMNASISAVLAYLDRVDTSAAQVARARYACLSPWSREPAAYGRAALAHGFAICENPVTSTLVDLLEQQLAYARHDGDQFFDAAQNARLVVNAERYYRTMYFGSHVSWNLRDQHMFETLHQIMDHAGQDRKVVVWAHNSHIGDARFTDMGRKHGELNIGQLAREAFGEEAALVGFGTASGTVAAASEWDAPMEIKTIRPPRADSYEGLCRAVDIERFLFDFRAKENDDLRGVLSAPRLARYIGVIYRPETERTSHYSTAILPHQYDAFVWFDHTHAVTPLPTIAAKGGSETYPFGL